MKFFSKEVGLMKFIKVKTKEKSFNKFYELLRTYKHTEDEKNIYNSFCEFACIN